MIVVDNGSTDGSREYLSRTGDVTLIANDTNMGFTHAANQLLTAATSVGAEWLLLHNTDAFIVDDITRHMVDIAISSDKVGIVGPRVLDAIDYNQHGNRYTIQCAGDVQIRPRPKDNFVPRDVRVPGTGFVIDETSRIIRTHTMARTGHEYHDDFPVSEPVEFYTFVSVLISLRMIHEIGPLDESMVNYGSDTELCMRARRHGWSIWYQPLARVWHIGNASSHAQYTEQTINDLALLDDAFQSDGMLL